MSINSKRSPLALAILVLLSEEPTHAYRMQQLIKERGKDQVINVAQRTSLYQTIARLEREGLLQAQSVSRDKNRPERTIYRVTPAGTTIMLEWTRQILSAPGKEFPEFPAAVSMLGVLTPKEAARQLEKRMVALQAEIARLDHVFADWSFLPRLALLEFEYLRAQTSSELQWVQAVVEDLRSGRLEWKKTWLKTAARNLGARPLIQKGLDHANTTTT